MDFHVKTETGRRKNEGKHKFEVSGVKGTLTGVTCRHGILGCCRWVYVCLLATRKRRQSYETTMPPLFLSFALYSRAALANSEQRARMNFFVCTYATWKCTLCVFFSLSLFHLCTFCYEAPGEKLENRRIGDESKGMRIMEGEGFVGFEILLTHRNGWSPFESWPLRPRVWFFSPLLSSSYTPSFLLQDQKERRSVGKNERPRKSAWRGFPVYSLLVKARIFYSPNDVYIKVNSLVERAPWVCVHRRCRFPRVLLYFQLDS